MSEPEVIDPKQLRSGPIRHQSLPPDVIEQAEAVFDVIGSYLGTTLEQFEVNLMRDRDPKKELIGWCRITTARWRAARST